MTTETMLPIPIKNVFVLVDLRLVPTEKGTRLVQSFSKPKGPVVGRIISTIGFSTVVKQARHDIEAFKMHIEHDLLERGVGLEALNPSENR
jgi:hypothetical protein